MEEVVLAFRTPKPKPVTESRSTLIVSAIQTLRARGLYERYVELLSPGLRQEIMSLVAGLWIPGALALEHYWTMDRLALPRSTIESIGAEVAERGYRTVLPSVAALSKRNDVTPWDLLRMAHRNLDNNWRGSDVMIKKQGPQHATFIWEGQPCASVPYFVTSWGAFLGATMDLVCAKSNHRVMTDRCSPTTIALELTWV